MVDCFLLFVTQGTTIWMQQISSANLSAVQHQSCAANHRNNWHFPGAQDFQILLQRSKLLDPWQRASYVDLAVYYPDVDKRRHICVSCTSCRLHLVIT
jgi:hypothetical protein